MSKLRALIAKTVELEARRIELIRAIERQYEDVERRRGELTKARQMTQRFRELRLEHHPSRATQSISAGEMRALAVQNDGIAAALASWTHASERSLAALMAEDAKMASLNARLRALEIEKKSIERAMERMERESRIYARRKLEEPDL